MRVSCFVLLLMAWMQFPVASAKTLRLAIRNSIQTTDPLLISSGNDALVLGQVFENLYSYDSHNQIHADLVERHELSEDGRTIVLHLRVAKFSDGTELRAEHVRASLNRAKRKKGKELQWALGDVDRMEILGPRTLKVSLLRPSAVFLHALTCPHLGIVLEKSGKLYGTGDYVQKLPQQLERRSGAGPERIEFSKIADQAAEMDAFKKNQIDAFVFLGDVRELNQTAGFESVQLQNFHYLLTKYLVFNLHSSFFKDAKSRCSFGQSFRAAALKKTAHWRPIENSLPFLWYENQETTPVARAVRPQLQVGFSGGVHEYSDEETSRLQGELKSEGYDVVFRRSRTPDLLKALRAGKADVILIGYIPDYLGLSGLLSPIVGSHQMNNYNHFMDSEIDRLLSEAQTEMREKERNLIYQRVFRRFYEVCPVYFVGAKPAVFAAHEGWKFPEINGFGIQSLKAKDVHESH